MPRIEIYDFAVGEDSEFTIEVENTTVVSANIVVVQTIGGSEIVNKTITTALNAHGQITESSGNSLLRWLFSAVETAEFDALVTYYPFSIRCTADAGNIFDLPMGKIHTTPRVV